MDNHDYRSLLGARVLFGLHGCLLLGRAITCHVTSLVTQEALAIFHLNPWLLALAGRLSCSAGAARQNVPPGECEAAQLEAQSGEGHLVHEWAARSHSGA